MASFAVTFNSVAFTNIQKFYDNFADIKPSTVRLAGLSGGFDQFGIDPAPSNIGKVVVEYRLVAAARADMQAAINTARALAWAGRLPLYFQSEGTAAVRFTYARVIDVDVKREPANNTDLFQPVTITFEAADPHWYEAIDTDTVNASGTSTDSIVAHGGNVIAIPKFVIACGAAQTLQNPTIRRLVGGVTVDEVVWTGTIGNNESLTIDCQAKSVTKDGVDSYATFDFKHADWFRLASGNNAVRVIAANAGDAATVTITHYPTYI